MGKQVEELQNEIKLLKNEIKESLIDIREFLLTNPQNPFPVDPDGEPRRVEQAAVPPARPANADNPSLTVSQPVVMGTPPPMVQPAPPMMPNFGMGFAPNVMPSPGPEGGPTVIQGPTVVAPRQGNLTGNGQNPPATAKESEPESVIDKRDEGPRSAVSAVNKYERPSRDAAAGKKYERFSTGGKARRSRPRRGYEANRRMDGKSLLGEYEEDTEHEYADADEDSESESEPTRDEMHDGEADYPRRGSGPDPLTVVKLASWTEDAVQKVGRHRLTGILDLYEATGGLSAPMKDALIRLASLAVDPAEAGEASLSQCMWVFLDLDNLIARTRATRRGLGES